MTIRPAACLAFLLATAGCSAGSGGVPVAGAPPPRAATPGTGLAPQVMQDRDTAAIIGQPPAALTARFGVPRIDLAEGDARKLQFVSERCVLDIYLYPLAAGVEPTATHVEARERQGGTATERAPCIAEIERAARQR